ncbi:hypothetical protein K2224_33820 (plasmid) [Streptomyces sp. BHT-5-2]|uniref:hypothetical protein n=1 Tax=Streptomyces sp. BHT-5-2 TaxID=2866715 RepID=UPI001C8E316F|nr:hypothetical protein [Streptomyces sp. BHT-5-2]QZL08127.1 hypothetical protein K2224_33820 [Streptomyces sp. BHT-5-2]
MLFSGSPVLRISGSPDPVALPQHRPVDGLTDRVSAGLGALRVILVLRLAPYQLDADQLRAPRREMESSPEGSPRSPAIRMQTKSRSTAASTFPQVRCQSRSGAVPAIWVPSTLTRRFLVSFGAGTFDEQTAVPAELAAAACP